MSTTSNQHQSFIVGLGGPSGSGKSTVAKRVASRLDGNVISLEVYSAAISSAPFEEREKMNYDVPGAIDLTLLVNNVRDYAAGKAVDAPIYDFAQHLRVENQHTHIPAKPLLIVEGILALYFEQLRPYFNLSIYLDAPDEICFHRRRVRDITERQRHTEFIQWQWENIVLPAARQYALPSKRYADLVLDSTADIDTVERGVYDAISVAIRKHALTGLS